MCLLVILNFLNSSYIILIPWVRNLFQPSIQTWSIERSFVTATLCFLSARVGTGCLEVDMRESFAWMQTSEPCFNFLLGGIHSPRVVQILRITDARCRSLPHILLRRIELRNSEIRTLRCVGLVWRMNVWMSWPFCPVLDCDLSMRMCMGHLHTSHGCPTVFSTFVYNPLVDRIIGSFRLWNCLFPALFRLIYRLTCGASLRTTPWTILTRNVPIGIYLLWRARLGSVDLLMGFSYDIILD